MAVEGQTRGANIRRNSRLPGFSDLPVRGLIHFGGTESVLWSVWLSLLVFSVVGYLIGWVAEKIVEDSVRGRISAELAGEETARAPQPAASGAAAA